MNLSTKFKLITTGISENFVICIQRMIFMPISLGNEGRELPRSKKKVMLYRQVCNNIRHSSIIKCSTSHHTGVTINACITEFDHCIVQM